MNNHSLTLRNGIYYVDSKSTEGKRLRISTGMSEFAPAQREAVRLLRLSAASKSSRNENTLRTGFAKMWTKGERWHDIRTPEDSKQRSESIMQILGADMKLDGITSSVMYQLRSELLSGGKGKRTEATVQRYMHCLTAMLNTACRDWQWIDHVSAYKSLKKAREREEVLSEDEISMLLGCEHRPNFRLLWMFLLDTGARLGETLALEWEDISLKDNTVFFRASTTKALKAKFLPISQQMSTHLRQVFLSKSPKPFAINHNTAQAYFEQTRIKAGIKKGVSIHTLRHTCATNVLVATGNLKLVQVQLGHATITTTARYAKVDMRQLDTVCGLVSKSEHRVPSVTK